MVRLPGKAGLHEDIVRVSIELGSELGEDGLTMRAIASRLGVSATALYQHFESKSAILREIRFLGTRDLLKTFEPAFSVEDPLERLLVLARQYVEFALSHPWLYKVLFQEEDIDWSVLSTEEKDRIMAPRVAVQGVVDECQKLGVLRRDIDPFHCSLLLWTSVHGLASLLIGGRISDQHPAYPITDREAFIAAFVESMVRSLQTASAPAGLERHATDRSS